MKTEEDQRQRENVEEVRAADEVRERLSLELASTLTFRLQSPVHRLAIQEDFRFVHFLARSRREQKPLLKMPTRQSPNAWY